MTHDDRLTFRSVGPPPFWSTITGLIGVAMLVVSITQKEPAVAWAAVVPICWSMAGFLVRPGSVEGSITSHGIQMGDLAAEIPFGPSVGLSAYGRNPHKPGRPFAIHVDSDDGSITIPKRLDIPSGEVFRAILKRLPPQGSEKVAPFLAEYHAKQIAMFGAELVFSARAFSGRMKEQGSGVKLRAWSLGTMVAGLVYLIAVAFIPENGRFHSEFIGFGVLLMLMGALFLGSSFLLGGRSILGIRHWRGSGVVIGPVGLALVQGDIRGELAWNQLLNVEYRPRSFSFEFSRDTSASAGILLEVEGAKIVIADLYDRPLDVIYERIMRNWRP